MSFVDLFLRLGSGFESQISSKDNDQACSNPKNNEEQYYTHKEYDGVVPGGNLFRIDIHSCNFRFQVCLIFHIDKNIRVFYLLGSLPNDALTL